MKQVSPKIYDKDFFNRVYGEDNSSFDFNSDVSKYYYKEMLQLKKLKKSDVIVDYGCGNGSLAFLLWKKYRCKIIAFDYSKDAISICRTRLIKIKKKFPKIDIKFLVANNNNLPKLANIKAVYFCDVIEHMYEDEIFQALKTIRGWAGEKGLSVIIHTDSDIYLRFVRPIINLFLIAVGRKTFKKVVAEKAEEDRVHVNLTNFMRLKKTMSKCGGKHFLTKFPQVTKAKIEKQLSGAIRIPALTSLCFKILNFTPWLSPSFYSIYRFQKKL